MDERLIRLGLSALTGNFKTLEVLARRGLLDPQEVDHIWGEIVFVLSPQDSEPTGGPDLGSIVHANLDGLYARVHQLAKETWRE